MNTESIGVPPMADATAVLLREADAPWAAAYERVLNDAWSDPALSLKEKHLVLVALSAAITRLDRATLAEQIAAALAAGASHAEIHELLKMGAVLALHSMSLAAPILIEEAQAAGISAAASPVDDSRTPSIAMMKNIGQWNAAWEPFAALDPVWTDAFVGAGTGFYAGGVFTPKFVELLSIGIDAAISHMYAPGVRRHIKAALAAGATPAEILAVLKLCVSYGAVALNTGLSLVGDVPAESRANA